MNIGNYKYAEIDITPRIVEELILELFSGQIIKLGEVADIVAQTHADRGGIHPGECIPSNRFYSNMKKGLNYLKEKGYADLVPHQRWKIIENRNLPTLTKNIPDQKRAQRSIVEPNDTQTVPKTITIGIGSGTVYIYYYPRDKRYALSQRKSFWQCKIGMTENDVGNRVKSQRTTAIYENPEIGLEILADNPRALEKAIHAVLEMKDRKIDTSGNGNEWFLTSPTEVAGIYTLINGI